MRIIGGEYRSRLIRMPKGVDIRPTQDKVRQAIFNVLGNIADTKVLELFAGTGAFGIEALSRGARHVTFVDNNGRCNEAIRSNLDSLDVGEERYDIIKTNALSVFSRLEKEEEKFDIVFLDPPYHKGFARKCLISLDSYAIVSDTGLVVIEHFKKDELVAAPVHFVREKERRYGDTLVTIFRKITHEATRNDRGISGDL